jgi:hypothetical protein
MSLSKGGWVMSEVTATIIGALIGGVFVLVGVWVGYYFSKRASEGDRHAELQYTIYKKIEIIKNLLMAFKKKMISQELLHERWNRATEELLVALIRSGLSKDEKKNLLHAINLRWENPESIKKLQQAADDLLKKLDPEFADAASEVLNEFGIKPEDIDPVILVSKSTMK